MQIFRPEVHSLFLRPFLDDVRASGGQPALRSLLEPFEVTEDQLRDETAWVSLEFCEALFQRMLEATGDPTLFERCGRLCLQARYLGIIRPIFRAFGSPMFTYTQVVQSTRRFNKVGDMRILVRQRGLIRLEYAPIPGAAYERRGLVCQARAAQLAAIPTMFDLAPARTTHLACTQSGSPACIYELAWREPRRLWSLLAAAAGVCAAALAFGHLVSPLGKAAVLLGLPAGLWALGRVVELKRDLSERARELSESQEALVRAARLNEERYAQLLESKEQVDRRVDERTRELRETSSRLTATLQEVRALSRAKADFFANVSHELRTPLTLILTPLDLLLTGDEIDPSVRRQLEIVQRSARQLRGLIDQILDLEKIDAGAIHPEPVPVDPVSFCTEVMEAFLPAASARGLDLRLQSRESRAPVTADPAWLSSALNNVLANALRFARNQVILRLLDAPDALIIEIEDDGPGVPEADRETIFERFKQSSQGSDGRQGTGLGLAIAREAARLQDGDLTVHSELGRGAIFRLRLPGGAHAGAKEKAPGEDRERPAVRPEVSALAQTPNGGDPSVLVQTEERRIAGPTPDAPWVLVVEDQLDLRQLVGGLLAKRYQVHLAADGAEALEICRRRPPDAIVSDIAMPRMNGLELCRRIRADSQLEAVPFLLLTAWGAERHLLAGFEAGADDFVAKPFSGPELLARVDVHVRLRRLVRQMAHRERLATLGTLAASLAHQIRNPLTAIRSGVFGLRTKIERNRLDPSRASEVLNVVNDCANRIDRVIGALLDIARLDHEEMTAFRPADSIRACLRICEGRLPAAATIDQVLDDEAEIRGRPGDMGHVFLNLIDNAIRAIPASGRIEVRAFRRSNVFVFEIGDSGPGVPAEEADWILSPFTTKRPAGEGTGLGLYIASEVVRQHGGRLEVDRSALGGALFRVEIPATTAQGSSEATFSIQSSAAP